MKDTIQITLAEDLKSYATNVIKVHAQYQIEKVEKIDEETYRIYAHGIEPITKKKSELERMINPLELQRNPTEYVVNSNKTISKYYHPKF